MTSPHFSQKKNDWRFIRDVAFSYVGPFVLRFRSFLLLPLIIRLLGTESYGVWTQFEATSQLLVMIAAFNFGVAMNRLLAGKIPRKQLSDDVISLFVVQLGIAGFLIVFFLLRPAWVADFLFGNSDFSWLIPALSLYVFVILLGNIFWGMMRAQRHNKELAVINSLRWTLEFAVIGFALFFTRSLKILFVALLIFQIVINFAYPAYALFRGWFQIQRPRFTRLSQYIHFSWPLFGTTLGFWVLTSGDYYFIRWFLGIGAVGMYAAMYKFGNLIILLMVPLTEVLLPDISALYDEGKLKELNRRMRHTIKYFSIISAISIMLIVGSSRLLIAISGIPATEKDIVTLSTVLLLIAVGSTFMGLGRILIDVLSVKKLTRLIGGLWLFLALISSILHLIWIPLLGINGAALSIVVTFTIGLIFIYYLVKKHFPLLNVWQGWGLQALLLAAVCIIASFLLTINVKSNLPVGAMSAVIFIGALWAAKVIESYEFQYGRELFLNIRGKVG